MSPPRSRRHRPLGPRAGARARPAAQRRRRDIPRPPALLRARPRAPRGAPSARRSPARRCPTRRRRARTAGSARGSNAHRAPRGERRRGRAWRACRPYSGRGAREPEDAGGVEDRLPGFRAETLPGGERTQRHARVELVGAVAHADDPRLAAGARARARRSVLVDEEDAQPLAPEARGRPGAEAAGPDHRNVPGLHRRASYTGSNRAPRSPELARMRAQATGGGP